MLIWNKRRREWENSEDQKSILDFQEKNGSENKEEVNG